MANLNDRGASFSYSAGGSNTLTQVTADPAVLYHVSVTNNSGSIGYLQVYNNGTFAASAGTPDFAIAVHSGTAGAGTPSFLAIREVDYGPFGREMAGGVSYLWATGATGTVAQPVNAVVDITYRGTGI